MKHVIRFAVLAVLTSPALAADLVVTATRRAENAKATQKGEPAHESTRVTWLAKDRMRVEDEGSVTIVRQDEKKMFILHPKEKTYSVVELPFDMKKYLPPEIAPLMQNQFSDVKVTIVPTKETKKIKEWNTTKYTLTLSLGVGSLTRDMWVTKDVPVDLASYAGAQGSILSLIPGGGVLAKEFEKVEGFPVLMEENDSGPSGNVKNTLKEEVTSIESKEAPAGIYDVPKDFTEEPFDWMTDNPNMPEFERAKKRERRSNRSGRASPPAEKPIDPPKIPPVPEPKSWRPTEPA